MEVYGTMRIFRRSLQARNIRYTGYIGHGDTKTCEAVRKENYYGDEFVVRKSVGHIQKRVGNQLRKLKAIAGKTK